MRKKRVGLLLIIVAALAAGFVATRARRGAPGAQPAQPHIDLTHGAVSTPEELADDAVVTGTQTPFAQP